MGDIKVTWMRDRGANETEFAVLDRVIEGRLTTDHAMSSRGLPVVVAEDGSAFGPADVGSLSVCTYVQTDDEAERDIHRALTGDEQAMIAAARTAGYHFDVIS